MAMNGIDISNYQRGLDLSKVPCDFVICKATEGTSIIHNTCDPWIQQAKQLGKKWGFYHFAAGGDAIEEAEFFIRNTENYFGNGIPVLDYEMYGRKGTEWVQKWLDHVYSKTKVRCMVYCSRSVLKEDDWSKIAPNHALWVAQYPNSKPTGYQTEPWFPKGSIGAFTHVTMHQYASTGRLNGWNGNLDLDIAYLTPEAWDKIAQGDRKVTPKPTPAQPTTPTATTLDLVLKVMLGEYGNGEERKQKLGDRYQEVQDFINEIKTAPTEQLVQNVLNNKYGTGATRKTVLDDRYIEVQTAVNKSI